MQRPTLYLMFGYPGAGKTTASNVIHNLTKAVHVSSDQVRLELFSPPQFTPAEHQALYRTLNERTEALLKQGKNVIYDANLNRHQHRAEKYDICRRTGAKPVLLWVQTAKDLAKERASHASRQHLVPKQDESLAAMFDRIADVIEEPGPDEPYIVLDGTKITEQYISQRLDIS